jgi:LacI family transcriptional regulator
MNSVYLRLILFVPMNQTVAIVMSEVFLRRLTPALSAFSGRKQDYRILSIHRPIQEVGELLKEINPIGLISEWLPQKADDLLGLNLKIPHVMVGTHNRFAGVLSVDVDDLTVGREAADALSQVGFKSLTCLGNGTPYSDLRIQGFEDSVRKSELPFFTHTELGFEERRMRYSESFHDPSEEMKSWLMELPKPCGIFAVHDPLGRFLSGACSQLGIRVPDDVAIIGANNDPLVCGLTYPMLSSVSIPWDNFGQFVGSSMQRMIDGGSGWKRTLHLIQPSGVIFRHSANHLAVRDKTLRRSLSFMSERIKEPITVAELCDHLRIARRSLERKFKTSFNCTPWDMLCQMRVNEAKRLLMETGHPISRISELCGFNDPERMAVVFKRLTGKSPSSFRK